MHPALSIPFLVASLHHPAHRTAQQTPDDDAHRVAQVVRSHLDDARRCYEHARAARPDLAGTLSVSFVVAPDGRVRGEPVTRGMDDAPALASCVARFVAALVFPAPSSANDLRVTYPFTFGP